MNNFKNAIIFILVWIIWWFWYLLFNKKNELSANNENSIKVNNQNVSENNKIRPDKIEIIEFHNTQRCTSCLKAEELIQKTINTKFSEEVNNWLISFTDINIDLPENKDISNKFKAWGLSIAINTITNWIDNIEFDTNSWTLLSNEEKYISYFEKKINNLLNK